MDLRNGSWDQGGFVCLSICVSFEKEPCLYLINRFAVSSGYFRFLS